MKRFALPGILLFLFTFSPPARAYEGSWFGFGASWESLSSGFTQNGPSLDIEAGQWFANNAAYGGYFRSSWFGEIQRRPGSSMNSYELGMFAKLATEAGLYGKLLLGFASVNTSGDASGFKLGSGLSFSAGLGGGFLFPLTESFHVGPEVIYRHLTAGNGGDQVSVGVLVTYGF